MFPPDTVQRHEAKCFSNASIAYEEVLNKIHHILRALEVRFETFSHQQFSFITALDRCRFSVYDVKGDVSTIAQVERFLDGVSDNATDKRVFRSFLSLVRDLDEFRRNLMKFIKRKEDQKLIHIFFTWKRILEKRQDISRLRAKFPYNHVNQLSCDESKNHFGGIVSVLPHAMDCARKAIERIEITRAYRPVPGPKTGRKGEYVPTPPPCQAAWPSSPIISSPLSTPHSSALSLSTNESDVSFLHARKCNAITSRPATADQIFRRSSETMFGGDDVVIGRPSTNKRTQTRRAHTAKRAPLNYKLKETISEVEMRRHLKEKSHSTWRQKWKP